METKFKVGQVWRRRDDSYEVIKFVHDTGTLWPVWTESGAGYTVVGGWLRGGKTSPYDLVELVKDVDEPRAQTRLDAQLADAMQVPRGATAAELALFDAIMVARTHDVGDIKDYALSVLQLRRKLEQDISQ